MERLVRGWGITGRGVSVRMVHTCSVPPTQTEIGKQCSGCGARIPPLVRLKAMGLRFRND